MKYLLYTLPIILLGLVGVFTFPEITFAHANEAKVSIFNNGELTSSFTTPSANEAGGLSIAAANLNEDVEEEIIIGSGLGNSPVVRVYKKDGTELFNFLVFAETMGAGINVTACDLDGNGTNEIVVAPQYGGGPHVRFFSNTGEPIDHSGFFAYNGAFRGGVNLTCGDLDNDGKDELVTLPGPSGGPHVKVWKMNETTLSLHEEFFAFDATDNRGLVGVIHNGKLIISSQHASETNIKTFEIHSASKLIDEKNTETGTSGVSAIFVSNNSIKISTTSDSEIFDVNTSEKKTFDSPLGAIIGTSSDLNNDGVEELIVAPARPMFHKRKEPKYIYIDISKQRLFAYEYGNLANSFLVSSGKYPYATPIGETQVLANPLYVNYAWSYGPENPNNYDLGYVKYNLRIFPHIYIHYAYWHNNFGHPMSHGCVNVNYENMEWVYNWAEVGTPVTTTL